MDCWEHARSSRTDTPAVAVCTKCGVGLCMEHVVVCAVEHSNGPGASSRIEGKQKICCGTCRSNPTGHKRTLQEQSVC